jgi:tetratricopeptide (TPR) repeat protein
MLSHLHAQNLPLVAKALPQSEGLSFYASSLVGFNSSLNGDLNLRVFEILASGAMLLTDALAPESGLNDLWTSERELVSYGTPAELAEKARHAVANPEYAKAIGAAGARWFDEHFSESVRHAQFEALIFDGKAPAKFTLPSGRAESVRPPKSVPLARLIAGYEHVQELHRNLERVVVAVDDSVPEEFVRFCATLPRVEVRRGVAANSARVDFLAIGKGSLNSPALVTAMNVWAWEELNENDRVSLVRRCASIGLAPVDAAALIFSRKHVNTHTNQGAVARVWLEQGRYDDALHASQKELAKNPKSVDALLVVLELAQENGDQPAAQSAFLKLKTLSPNHPRLRELLAQPPGAIHGRRVTRLLRTARALIERQKWTEAGNLAREVLTFDAKSAGAYFILGCTAAASADHEKAVGLFGRATQLDSERIEYWRELARSLKRLNRTSDALAAWLHVSSMDPENVDDQFALAGAALDAKHGAIACEALEKVAVLQPAHPLIARWLPAARQATADSRYAEPRDLLLSHVEVTRLQGTGVLITRFFPDASRFVTVRSRTLYKGAVDFGGDHFSIDLPGLTESARKRILQRLLAAYQIRRILCIPFFASDFLHACAAREITGAPLCTYVMDDQVLYAREVSVSLAQRVFDASDLRLAISAEMIAEYSEKFGCSFGLLPPVVTTLANEVPNDWSPQSGNVRRCVMVGNIWSARQFEQLRTFTRVAGLKVDWFGNSKVAWLPQDKSALERDGIFCQGFLSEEQLAQRLAKYPFVLLPSGTLDGTEDNEWLTRLSLPSRMVFILTKTQTPMLVLGSASTAAARFVEQFGLGVSSNYAPAEAQEKIEQITSPVRRSQWLANARRLSPCFYMPDCGDWIWRSLEQKTVQPTPFRSIYHVESTGAALAVA